MQQPSRSDKHSPFYQDPQNAGLLDFMADPFSRPPGDITTYLPRPGESVTSYGGGNNAGGAGAPGTVAHSAGSTAGGTTAGTTTAGATTAGATLAGESTLGKILKAIAAGVPLAGLFGQHNSATSGLDSVLSNPRVSELLDLMTGRVKRQEPLHQAVTQLAYNLLPNSAFRSR